MSIYLLSPTKKEGTIYLPMIGFSLIANSLDLSSCDTLMFTSKQAVKSAQKIDPSWKKIPCIAIGGATKSQIESLGGKVIYHPKSFYAKTLNHEIIKKFQQMNILYLRPKKISFNSKDFLAKEGLYLEEQILYETSCIKYKKNDAPVKNSIIIFTSPSSIHCFMKSFIWDESYTAVVIGNATKKYLPKNACYEVADIPLIDACIAKAREILLSSNSK